jgi:hypothetical protein
VALTLSLALTSCGGPPPAVTGGPAVPNATVSHTDGSHTVSAALAGRSRAELDVMSGVTSLTVGTASLGGDLLRVSTPRNAGVRPDLVVDGDVQLYLDSTGRSGPATARVTLNSAVSWRLTFSGGTTRTSVYLGRGQLRGADFAAGSEQITMRLPAPRGNVTIVLAGGASQVALSVPAGVPARLRLDGGAASATLGGRGYAGIAGGTVLTMPGWAAAANRYDIEAPAGISAISVGNW